MKTCLRKAHEGEEYAVFDLIAQRVRWMDSQGIHQWNDTDYLNVYPLAYYRRNLENLYVLTDESDDTILCAAILLTEDARWKANEPSFYIHNFVSSLQSGGIGVIFMDKLCALAREQGFAYLRLDSADDNEKLASYYERLGFEPCGVCQDGKYHGILRQKKI